MQEYQAEESRLYEKEDPSSNVHHEKLNSFWYVVFKYWNLLGGLWGIKNLISLSSSEGAPDVDVNVEYSTFNNILHFINGYPLRIWGILNCLLVFEGFRRKNLQILLKVIMLMEVYMAVQMIITFFDMMSDAGFAIAQTLFKQRFPNAKVDKQLWSFFAVGLVLVWCSYYYAANLYATKKARDVLRGPQKHHRSF